MDQWEDPSSTHVSPELQVKASSNRPLGRVQSLQSPNSRLIKIPAMETLTEPGMVPHSNFTPNSYYAKPNPSSYYINSNSTLSPKHYSDYPGYKAGSEKEVRHSGQPVSMPEYKFAKEMEMDGQRLQNSGNPLAQYYSQSMQQMSPYASSYHGSAPKELGEKRISKGFTDFPDKPYKNGQDNTDNKGGFSPKPGYSYIREEGELYPGPRDIPMSGERNHKLMQAMQMYRSNQPANEGHRQAYGSYSNWRNNTATSGDISNLHKDTRLLTSDQQKDVEAINKGEMKVNKSIPTEQARADLHHLSNPKSNFDGQDPKLDPSCSPSNFQSKDDVMLMKGREMQQESDFMKSEVYRSRLFYRSDSMNHEFQGKEKMSPAVYDRNIRRPFQWNDQVSRHPLQEFQDSLLSPNKIRPNYPYSSTPGKNPIAENESISFRPDWKNGSSQMLKAFPTDKSEDGKQNFEIDKRTSTNTSSSNPKEAIERRSPSPIKSAYTPNTRMSYNSMGSPFTGSDHHHSKKHSGEQDGINDLKDALSYNDDCLLSKKEALSDDGCEESPYPGTRPDSSMSPPSPDSSMTYPPHFPHPYFASPIRGPPPIQRLQFGSPRGQLDAPQIPRPNFQFDKDFTGQFSVSGIAQEMAIGGPYMGPLPPNIVQGIGEDKDIFFCHLCSYSGKSKPEFDAHMNIHFEYNCPHCDYTSRTEGRLKRHIKDFHSDDSSRRALPGRPKVYKCKQCPFSAKEKDKFWDHARTHIKEDKLLQCPKCSFVTEYKHHLEYHLRNHFNSKPYKCNKCNYSCVNKSMLNSHMKSHTNVYQYRCSNCTYATKYCHSLKLHLKKYNHKPATVLNQDGSIPQGLDVESSGIAVVAKRGPPRGPRGMKKEKQERYGGQMFGMPSAPMGMNPMMNGMMPFWPILSHMGGLGHLSPSSGMLPGIGNLTNQIKMHGGDGDQRRMSDSDKMYIIDNSSDDESGHLRDDEFACRLCDFIGENTGALCVHFVQVHKDEAREVARACGVSEENLAASLSRLIPEMISGRRLSEPLTESDSEPSDYNPGNSSSGMAPQSPEVTVMQNEQKTTESKISPPKWTEMYPSELREESSYSQMLTSSKEHDDSMGETDILQQMTLKFGDANMLPEKTPKLPEEQRLPKETPLDLTKPKSVSPKEMTSPLSPSSTDFSPATVLETDTPKSQPFKKRMIREDEEESSGHDMTAQVPRKRSRKGKAYKLDTLCMKLQERQVNHAADSEESQSDSEIQMEKFHSPHSTIEVKKDSTEISVENSDERDTTQPNFKTAEGCFPLSCHQSEDEETDEYEVNDDGSDDDERRKNLNAEKDKITKSPDSNAETINIENNTSTEVDSEFKMLQRSLAILNSGIDPEIEGPVTESPSITTLCDDTGIPAECSDKMFPPNKSDVPMSTFEGEQKIQTIEKLKINCESERNNSDTNDREREEHLSFNPDKDLHTVSRSSDSIDKISSNTITSNEDSQSNLPITNYAEVVFPTTVSRFSCEDKSQLKDACLSSHHEQVGMEQELEKECRLNEVDGDQHKADDVQHKADDVNVSQDKIDEALQEESVDPVEMINTVLENRKKPVPPAVRRGTELAWKLLHDTVNPVTSLPLPIDSPPLQQTQVSAPVVTCSHPISTSTSNPVRNNICLKPPLHFSQRTYPSQRPVHPMNPHIHMPLPPTPMAFIPPTSHMMPEPAPMVRPLAPPPPMKMVKPEEYSCNYCGLSFQDCVMYTVHMGYHSNRNPFKCNSCGIVCRDKVDFFLHIARSPHA